MKEKYYFHNNIIANIEVKYELVKKESHRIITFYSLRELVGDELRTTRKKESFYHIEHAATSKGQF
jgi:hypothetical protein